MAIRSLTLWTLAVLLVVREGRTWRPRLGGPDWQFTRGTPSSQGGVRLQSWKWSQCDPDDVVHIKSLDLEPDDLHFPGSLTVSANVSLDSGLTSPVKLVVEVQRKIIRWHTIKCHHGWMGSCTFDDACTLSPYQATADNEDQLPRITYHGRRQGNTDHLGRGYHGDGGNLWTDARIAEETFNWCNVAFKGWHEINNLRISLPKVKVPKLFLKGHYKATARFTHEGQHLLCLETYFRID